MSRTLDVYLLRHGQTQWNADGNRYCGRTDIPLTETGRRQAETAKEGLKAVVFDAVYSSPLERAFVTAQTAGNGRPVIKDQRLIEVDFGKWEGLTKEEFIAADPLAWQSWMKDPLVAKAGSTGETATEVIQRVDDFFTEILRQEKHRTILVVGHNGINRLYLAWKLGMDVKHYRRIHQENSSITMFTLDTQGEITLKLLNSRGI
jgi:alpha-ribazole phosphatase/probable phosphoglycerate mutase